MPIIEGLNYFVHGTENRTRPPLVLIHGAGGLYLSWPPQIRRIQGQPVYAMDLPGHGKSEGLGRYTIEEYTEDVASFLTALGVPAAVIAGYSMGSAIALMLALKSPEHVCGLVLMGGGAKLHVSAAILDGLRDPNTFASTVKLINDYSFDRNAPPRLKELAMQRMAETRQTVLYNDFLACGTFDVTNRLGEIKVPTLIICGVHDKMMPCHNSEFLRAGIKNSRLEIVENAGHMAILEQPDILTDLLSRFLDEFPPLIGPQA